VIAGRLGSREGGKPGSREAGRPGGYDSETFETFNIKAIKGISRIGILLIPTCDVEL